MERNKSKLVVGAVLIIVGVALLLWSLSGNSAEAPAVEESQNQTNASQEQQDDTALENDATTESPKAEETTITFTNNGFSPAELSVKKGTIVTIVNDSSVQVQFSSDDHPTHRLNEGMNLPVLSPGQSDSFVAEEVGEWGFHDHIDDSLTGTITVTE